MTKPSPLWAPDRHRDRRPFLLARNRITAALRAWFAGEGFVEIEPSALQVSPGNEAHLHAFATELIGPDGSRRTRYLHTSPEFAAKKLLAAGEDKIVAFARVFRNREQGPLHAPEFTMVEWYRTGATYDAVIADCLALLQVAAGVIGASAMTWRGVTADPFAPATRITVDDAFVRQAGIDLAAVDGDTARFAARAREAGHRVAGDDTWSDLFARVLVESVEPTLGVARPAVLVDYPVAEASLARRKASNGRLAERFELYACGVELANGFSELTDPAEQKRRFEAEMSEKIRVYGETYPIDPDFLEALAEMPEAAGVALGLDRLVMLLTGADSIEKVQWNPVDTEYDRS
ncbi:EF-P lysine aminoacylase EpmA [Bauldia sp.]|uniref:EF-P lysine aminoacylase EpmA n=1 Tax=Bauldia sp. TaxID=2575872 RepID=UPI003BAC1A5A